MDVKVGVGIIILNEKKEVLLVLRNEDNKIADSDMHLEGTWTLPSGKVKFQETFEEAAIRKSKEEVNLEVDNLKLISLANDKNEYAHFATIGFLATSYKGEVKYSSEFTNYMWAPLNDLPKNTCEPSIKIINNYKSNKIYDERKN